MTRWTSWLFTGKHSTANGTTSFDRARSPDQVVLIGRLSWLDDACRAGDGNASVTPIAFAAASPRDFRTDGRIESDVRFAFGGGAELPFGTHGARRPRVPSPASPERRVISTGAVRRRHHPYGRQVRRRHRAGGGRVVPTRFRFVRRPRRSEPRGRPQLWVSWAHARRLGLSARRLAT